MNLDQLTKIISDRNFSTKTFQSHNFGCRVNAAEINLLSQLLINIGFTPLVKEGEGRFVPSVILVNTCSITKKGEVESLGRIRHLSTQYPDSLILATGCAHLEKVQDLPNVLVFSNQDKEDILKDLDCAYTSNISDKFSHNHRFILKVQTGCTQCCAYCTVPYRRQLLWSLSLDKAVATVNQAVADGYKEVIITGINLSQYTPGLSNLLEALLKETTIELISFGSIPINCIDDKFLSLISSFSFRVSSFFHIPLQSGSDRILKLMNRPYDRQKAFDVFSKLKELSQVIGRSGEAERDFEFGTDIIVGFPGETDPDFQDTYDFCQSVGFTHIHTFRYSPRPNTLGKVYYNRYPKLSKDTLKARSAKIRSLI